jgi:hypothetical protein
MALVLDTRDVETRQWLESIGRPEVVIDLRDAPPPIAEPQPESEPESEPEPTRSGAVRFFAAGVASCGLLLLTRQVILRRRGHR